MSDGESGGFTVQSHKGPYSVSYTSDPFTLLADRVGASDVHFMVDQRVAELYGDRLGPVLDAPSVLPIEALERNKSLDRMPGYVDHLLERKIQRGHTIVALGGGIIQDIVCFIASVLMRGIDWEFLPTTLLAQADSCIGSKSSINVSRMKNAVGTFHPPARVVVATLFLGTLEDHEVRSGMGEMIKVHVIDGPESFDELAAEYDLLRDDDEVMQRFIDRSLRIKKELIEVDEFDRGVRQVLNYGHTFGHALESATGFGVPHGLAVTIGMDMANYTAVRLGRMDAAHRRRMYPVLHVNAEDFWDVQVPLDDFLVAISKDKKNVGSELTLILPDGGGVPEKLRVPNDKHFRNICREYFQGARYISPG